MFSIRILFLILKIFLRFNMELKSFSSGREFSYSCLTNGWHIIGFAFGH